MTATAPAVHGTTVIDTPERPLLLRSVSYDVPSATEPGVHYTVTTTDTGAICTCPAGTYRRDCWHRKAVKAGAVNSKPRVRVMPLPRTLRQMMLALPHF